MIFKLTDGTRYQLRCTNELLYMIKLTKQPKESNEKLMSRFQKKLSGSRIITMKKERTYFKKPLKKRLIRARAIVREGFRLAREKKKYM